MHSTNIVKVKHQLTKINFVLTYNGQLRNKIEKKIEFTIVTKTIMYIGIRIVNHAKDKLLIDTKEYPNKW